VDGGDGRALGDGRDGERGGFVAGFAGKLVPFMK
jgi:hypothetical protein